MAESLLSVTATLGQFIDGVARGSTVPKLRNFINSVVFRDGSNDESGGTVFYVGKHGSDARSGRAIHSAFLSIGKAITTVSALTPADDNQFSIVVLDAGIYAESLSLPSYVHLLAPAARIAGTGLTTTPVLTLASNASATVRELVPQSGQGGVITANTSGIKRFRSAKVSCSGSGGYGAVNVGGAGGVLYYAVEETRVGESALGIGDISTATGHMHVEGCGDFYLEGANAFAITRIGAGTTIGAATHILELGDGVGTGTAFSAGAGGSIDMFVNEVSATTPKTGSGTITVMTPAGAL